MKCKNCDFSFEGNFCPNCGCPTKEETSIVQVDKLESVSSMNGHLVDEQTNSEKSKNKKSIFKKWWFYLIIVLVLGLGIFGVVEIINNSNTSYESNSSSPNVVVTQEASKMVAAYCYAAYADVQYAQAQNVYCTSLGDNQYKITGKAYVYDKYGDHYYGKFTAVYKYEDGEAIKISLDVETPRLEN